MRTVLLVLILSACTYPGTDPAPQEFDAPDLADIVDHHPCGAGFQAGNPAQTLGVFLEPADFAAALEGRVVREGEFSDGAWTGTVVQGYSLFSNWCDDVFEPGEPTPVRVNEYTIVSGRFAIDAPETPECGPATITLVDLVIDVDGEEVSLGDLTIENPGWGCFAG